MSCFWEIATLSGVQVITLSIFAGYRIMINEKLIKLEKENKEEKKELKELKEKFCEIEKKLESGKKDINFQTR